MDDSDDVDDIIARSDNSGHDLQNNNLDDAFEFAEEDQFFYDLPPIVSDRQNEAQVSQIASDRQIESARLES